MNGVTHHPVLIGSPPFLPAGGSVCNAGAQVNRRRSNCSNRDCSSRSSREDMAGRGVVLHFCHRVPNSTLKVTEDDLPFAFSCIPRGRCASPTKHSDNLLEGPLEAVVRRWLRDNGSVMSGGAASMKLMVWGPAEARGSRLPPYR